MIWHLLKNNKSGMTLMEMVVAISIFTTVVFMSSNIFSTIMSGQRRSIAQQNTQENMRYLFEIISKEIRHAQRSDGECYGAAQNRNFNTNPANNILYFKNKNDECVSYALVDGVLMIRRGARNAQASPDFLEISGLTFEVTDNRIVQGSNPRVQPRVTFKMRSSMRNQAVDNIVLNMQSTISSRYYE